MNRRNMKNAMAMFALMMAITFAVAAVGCGGQRTATRVPGSSIIPARTSAVTEIPTNNANEIAFTGVLTFVNTSDFKMHYIDISSGVEYEVRYTGGTDIQNSYGKIKAASTMELGELYDVTCDKTGKATKIYGSADAWERTGVTGMTVDESNRKITVGNTEFRYESYALILSEAERISIAEIVAQDEVTLRGIDNKVYSINLDAGHGYIRLTGVDSFVDGYLTIGKNQLFTVAANMLVTAPVGTYAVELQKGSLVGSKTVTVTKDQEVELDFVEYTTAPIRLGVVRFMVTPSNAIMAIDGTEVDFSEPISLAYGTHRVRLQANYYEAYTTTITVSQDYATVVIDMTPSSNAATTAASSESTTASNQSTTAASNTPTASTPTTSTDLTAGYSVNVTTPEGGTLYVDGVYIGTIPCSFEKSSGNKTVTISRSGFATISYTISIANAIGDVSYAFPDLVAN